MRWRWVPAEDNEWGGTLQLVGTSLQADVLSCNDATIMLWESEDRVFAVIEAADA